jgi:hypothetical protein
VVVQDLLPTLQQLQLLTLAADLVAHLVHQATADLEL